MKKIGILLIFWGLCAHLTSAQSSEFMQITTVESTVEGGGGRSRMLITFSDGKQQEADMNNLFSLLGVNFKNIQANERQIVAVLNEYAKKGWKLVTATPLVPVSSDNSLCMTRYLLMKN
jgi:hypothetical protein